MKISKATRTPIVVDIDGAKLTFGPASHQDLVYATNVLQYVASGGLRVTPVDRDTMIKHVFSKLKDVEGVLCGDDPLTAEQMRNDCLTYSGASLTPILNAWATEVLAGEGFLPKKEAEEKKAPAPQDSTLVS